MNNKESLKRTARTVAYLIYARESKKLTRAKVAVRCGISQNMLVRYECGSSIPSLPLLFKWCDALEVEACSVMAVPRDEIPEVETQARMILELYEASVLGNRDDTDEDQMSLF